MLSSCKRRLLPLFSKDRLGKFISVGVIGALFDTTILLFLVEILNFVEEVAVLIGIESAILLMFVLNERWTFANIGKNTKASLIQRLLKSHLVRSGGVISQFIIFVLIYRVFFISVEIAGVDAWLLIAKATGIIFGMSVNYTFETIFTWSVDKNAK